MGAGWLLISVGTTAGSQTHGRTRTSARSVYELIHMLTPAGSVAERAAETKLTSCKPIDCGDRDAGYLVSNHRAQADDECIGKS